MIRTQIQLTEQQAEALKAMSKQHGLSMAELIRRSIEYYIRAKGPVISDEERRWRAIAVSGTFHSGVPDLGLNHDKYLEDAYMDWKEKKPARGNIR